MHHGIRRVVSARRSRLCMAPLLSGISQSDQAAAETFKDVPQRPVAECSAFFGHLDDPFLEGAALHELEKQAAGGEVALFDGFFGCQAVHVQDVVGVAH